MADDITYTDSSPAGVPNSTKQVTDEHSTRGHMPVVKLAYSADGDATHVPADADGVLVNLGSNNDVTVTGTVTANAGTGPFPVSDNGGSLTVDGTVSVTGVATAANQTTVIGHLDGVEGLLTTIDADTGTLAGAVSGTEVQVDVVAALPAGNNNIGDVDIASGTVTTVSTLTGGGVAHDAADSGNPHKIGAKAGTSDQTAVATGDRTDLRADTLGHLVVRPYALHENLVSGATSDITDTTSTSVIAAQGAGVRTYVTSLTVTNGDADTGTFVSITDGSGGTTLWTGYAASAGGGATVHFPTPLRTTANTALHAVCATTGATVRVSASGYKSAV